MMTAIFAILDFENCKKIMQKACIKGSLARIWNKNEILAVNIFNKYAETFVQIQQKT